MGPGKRLVCPTVLKAYTGHKRQFPELSNRARGLRAHHRHHYNHEGPDVAIGALLFSEPLKEHAQQLERC